MSETKLVALVGNPNCGKSALFNTLTGLRQKVANYPGATVDRRVGRLQASSDAIDIIDLPGTYSMKPKSMDEAVTVDVLTGTQEGTSRPDAIVCIVDATNLGQHLRLVLEIKNLGLPMVVALNMVDMARRDGIEIDSEILARELGVPVIETVAVRSKLVRELTEVLQDITDHPTPEAEENNSLRDLQRRARLIANVATIKAGVIHQATRLLDRIVLNVFLGPIILFGLLFTMFQAVFSWAEVPMDMIEAGVAQLQVLVNDNLSDGYLSSFLSDGILAGVGSVIVFLPQILILFIFILALEGSGYMARAAFLMDKLMAKVGLNGRAFIPLLSSFACAVPGIMAARAISSERDRLTTILIAPLMTCSARLPVYTLIIAAFIPNDTVYGMFNLPGLVMFALYMAGIISALLIAAIFKRTLTKGGTLPLIMELPKYQLPSMRYMAVGLYERARIFIRRAGTIILVSVMVLWVLSIYPNAPEGADHADIYYSMVGLIGRGLAIIFEPIGFNWEISVALVPGMAAREVAVAALGSVYALSGSEDMVAASLSTTLRGAWSLPTALSFLAWFVYAPQCLSTIAVTRRETGGWKWPIFMLAYLFVLAYGASFVTFHTATYLLT